MEAADGAAEVIIQAIHRVLRLRLGGLGHQHPPALGQLPQLLAQVGPVGDLLGQDVAGPLQGIPGGVHPLLRVYKSGGLLFRVQLGAPLGGQAAGEGLQALLPGDGGPGAPRLLIGTVQVLYLCQGGCGGDGGSQFLCQLALGLNGGGHLPPALVQVPQILQPVRQPAQQLVVHGPVKLLAIAGDKWDGGPLVNKPDHILHINFFLPQLLGQGLDDGFHVAVLLRSGYLSV